MFDEWGVGSRLGATFHGCGTNPPPTRSQQAATLQWVWSERESTACRRYAVDGCVGDAPVVVSPTLSVGDASVGNGIHPPTSSLGEGLSWYGMWESTIYIGIPLCYHNRASPMLDITERPLCPTLSVSDAEHGVTHDSCTSGTAAAAVSTTRLRSGLHRSRGTSVMRNSTTSRCKLGKLAALV